MIRFQVSNHRETRGIRILTFTAAGVVIFLIFLLFGSHKFYKGSVIFPQLTSPAAESENLITVVTAYYQIPSKHNHTEYMEWIANFLPNIPCHLYVFTSKAVLPELAPLRKQFPDRTRFVIKELHELEQFANMDLWLRTNSMDRETFHTPELYAIWNQKWHFVDYAIKENVFHSDYFIWCDIGSFRSHMHVPLLRTFPMTSNIEKFGGYSKITMLLIHPFSLRMDYIDKSGFPSLNLRRGDVDHIGGTLAGGHFIAWKLWLPRYYAMQKLFFGAGIYAGKDQNVMNAVALKYPENVQLIRPEPYFNGTGNPWFYLQYYFSL